MSVNEVLKQEVIEINKIKLDGALTIINLNANMEQLENAVKIELAKDEYNSIVTIGNFKDMKESSLFLGKVAKQISDFRIAKVKEETTDIKTFEDALKKFTNMFKSKQDEIKQGLDVFEEKTRKQVKQVCITYFDEYSLQVGLKEEFQIINLEDMTQTGFMTTSGAISKKGKEEIERRVQVQLNLQNKVENRLMMLENECLKVGIEPLTKQHIQGFIFADDDAYMQNLNMLIESELRRTEQIKVKQEQELREKIEAENKASQKLPFEETNFVKEESLQGPLKENFTTKEIKKVDEDGKVTKTLSCTIRVPKDATDEQVISAVIKMIKEDKFPIENIEVN